MYYQILILLLGVSLIQSNDMSREHSMQKRDILSISSSPSHIVSSVPVKTYVITRDGKKLYVTSDQLNLTQEQVLQKVEEFERSQQQMQQEMQQNFDAMAESFKQMANAFGQMIQF